MRLAERVLRAYRMPYSDALADKTHAAENEIKAGHPQGGCAADFDGGDGSIVDMVREYVTPKIILETTGGDSSTSEFKAPTDAGGAVFTPLPPPRMPPKDEQ